MNLKGLFVKDFMTCVHQFKSTYFMIIVFLIIPNFPFFALSLLMTAMIPTGIIGLDEKCGWNKYCLCMPYDKKDYVYEKYALALINLVAAMVLNLIVNSISKGFFTTLQILLPFVSMALFYAAVVLPCIFLLGSDKGRIISVIAIAVSYSVIGFFAASVESDSFFGSITNMISANISIILLVCSSILFVISLFLSQYFYNKKEI